MRELCIDCGINTTDEYFWLRDDVWPIDGILCIACLERRIDRQHGAKGMKAAATLKEKLL
jgi:hypothetical protein